MRIAASVFLLLCFSISTASAQRVNHTAAKQALLLDYSTGQVLYEKNADQRMPTSSMSKVMTMYMVFEALKDGRLNLEDKLLVSEKAWKKGGSKMFVEVGSRVKVEELVKGVIVQSGNDATIVLAEGLAGTEKEFAKAMTARAQELGMKNSNFVNASGWPDPNHYSTPRDLSILAKQIIRDFPEYFGYYSIKEFSHNGIRQKNRNPLIFRDMGADGIKTGHTEAAGYGLIGTGERNGRRVVLVINGLNSERDRAQESARLLEWGLKGFVNETLAVKNRPLQEVPVRFGKKDMLHVGLKEDITLTLPILDKEDFKLSLNYTQPMRAPVNKGDVIGKAVAHIPGYADGFEYDLIALEDVRKAGFFARTWQKASIFLFGEG